MKSERFGAYSPSRRTAVLLTGTGAHGAYHAGALKALQEAGVRIDIVAGHGVGAAAAALRAIDGGTNLWGSDALWQPARTRRLYRWKPPLRVAAWLLGGAALALLAPALLLVVGVPVYAAGFLLQLAAPDAGGALLSAYSGWLQAAFSNDGLPTLVPRLATLFIAAVAAVLAVGAIVGERRDPGRRRMRGGRWWRLAGAPVDAMAARHEFVRTIEQLLRGGEPAGPGSRGAGHRYADVLAENLGQPGFAELVLVATDLDAGRDVVAAMLREPFRQEFVAAQVGHDRAAEVFDLTNTGRRHALDLVAAAVTPPVVCDPCPVTFASESFWRGETHRLCDRPGAVVRLVEEAAAAGATQVVIVSAVAPSTAPHRLRAPRLDLHHRLGDFITAAESSALRDAVQAARLRFDAVYLIRPDHNPVGPFDFAGAYDEASDRWQHVSELIEHGYGDASRQFIAPVVGASGEQLARADVADGPAPGARRGQGRADASGNTLFRSLEKESRDASG